MNGVVKAVIVKGDQVLIKIEKTIGVVAANKILTEMESLKNSTVLANIQSSESAAIAENAKNNVLGMYNFGSNGNIIYFEPDEDGDLRPVPSTEWGMGAPLPLPLPTSGDAGKVIAINSAVTQYEYVKLPGGGGPVPVVEPVTVVLACMGDSVTAGSPYWISPDLNNPIPPPVESDLYSYPAHVRARGVTVHNLGIGGNTTRQMLARFGDVLALNPTHCILEGGINDVVQADRIVPYAETVSNFTSMITQCQNVSIVPILMLTHPQRQTIGLWTEAQQVAIEAIRAWQVSYAAANSIPVIDGYGAFVKELGTGDEFIMGLFTKEEGLVSPDRLSDTIHPNTKGYARLGELALKVLKRITQPEGVSKLEEKIYMVDPGTAYRSDYSAGDLLVNSKGGEGEFSVLFKSGNTDNALYTKLPDLRNVNSENPSSVGWYDSSSVPDKYWAKGDVLIRRVHPMLEFYKVTTAGYTGVIHTPHVAAELIASVPQYCAGEGWTYASLQNSWTNKGGAYANARYYKAGSGIVYLGGIITGGTVGATAFVLPTGYRPSHQMFFPIVQGAALGIVGIFADGTVQVTSGTSANSFGLDSISFRSEG